MKTQEWLTDLSKSKESSEEDSKMMQTFLRRFFPQAVVTYGIVYIEGKGTIKNRPQSIQAIAKELVDSL